MAAGIRRDGPRRQGARGRPGGLTRLGGLPPLVERRELRRGLTFPSLVTLKPVRPHAVKPGIPGGIETEGMPPSLRVCGPEDDVVDPLDEPEPDKLSLIAVRFAVGVQIGNKTRTSLIEERLHLGRYTALNLDHQTNPICEGAPRNEFRDRGIKASGNDEFALRLCLVTRPSAESDLSFAVSRGHVHLPSLPWGEMPIRYTKTGTASKRKWRSESPILTLRRAAPGWLESRTTGR